MPLWEALFLDRRYPGATGLIIGRGIFPRQAATRKARFMSQPSFEQFAAIRLIGSVKYSPDGTEMAYTANTTGFHNIWVMPAGGGFARQVTTFQNSRVTDFHWSPDGRQLAFTADNHGDEMDQVFVIDAQGGWPVQLTDAEAVQYGISGWTPDGRKLVVTGNDREPTEMDPQLIDVATGEVDRLMTGGQYYAGEVSPDGRHLTIVEFLGNTNQRLHLLDLETREARLLTRHEGEANFPPMAWALDSSGFYLLSNLNREFMALGFYSLEKDDWSYIHAPDREVEGFRLSRDGRTTVAAINLDGASGLQAYDMETGSEIPVRELPSGEITSLSLHPSERRVAMVFARSGEAANIYELDIETGELQAREQSMLGGIPAQQMIEPELVHFPSFDRDVPAWLFRPRGDGPFPVVVSIHGGPEAQERPSYAYSGLYQYLLSRGIGILAPNIRGSTGYGLSYQRLIYRDWGGAELEDIRHAAEYLRTLDWVAPDRLGVFGGSFGGFATLSALSRLPEYWAAGVDVVGPSNLITFVASVPPHWRSVLKEWVGDAEEDRDLLIERSPITYVDNIRAPLLVIQGANDPRVVQAESDQMVERLRELGREVEYYVDEESGHGPASREAGLKWWRMTGDFLIEKLTR